MVYDRSDGIAMASADFVHAASVGQRRSKPVEMERLRHNDVTTQQRQPQPIAGLSRRVSQGHVRTDNDLGIHSTSPGPDHRKRVIEG